MVVSQGIEIFSLLAPRWSGASFISWLKRLARTVPFSVEPFCRGRFLMGYPATLSAFLDRCNRSILDFAAMLLLQPWPHYCSSWEAGLRRPFLLRPHR